MDKGRGRLDPEESIQVLPIGRCDMATSEAAKQHTTPSDDTKRGLVGAGVRIPQEPLVWTPGNVGHVREAQREVLVARNVQGCAPVHDDIQELPNAFWNPTPRRATTHLPADHTLQVDGQSNDNEDGCGTGDVPGTGKDSANQVEARALMNKTTAIIC